MAPASSTPQSSSALMRRWKSAAFLFLLHFLACNQREGEKETKEGKDELKWRVVLSSTQWFIDPFGASPTFSSHHSGVNWTVFFCCDWRLLSAGYVFKLALIFPADWNYCFQSSLAFFRMIRFFECIQCLSWQVTSVKLNNLQCIVTTLSTKKNKGRRWQMALLSLIAKTNKTAQPSPSMKSCVEGNPLFQKRSSVADWVQRQIQHRFVVRAFVLMCLWAECAPLEGEASMSGHTQGNSYYEFSYNHDFSICPCLVEMLFSEWIYSHLVNPQDANSKIMLLSFLSLSLNLL